MTCPRVLRSATPKHDPSQAAVVHFLSTRDGVAALLRAVLVGSGRSVAAAEPRRAGRAAGHAGTAVELLNKPNGSATARFKLHPRVGEMPCSSEEYPTRRQNGSDSPYLLSGSPRASPDATTQPPPSWPHAHLLRPSGPRVISTLTCTDARPAAPSLADT